MIDRSKAGLWVRTRYAIRGYAGDVPRDMSGTIVYEHDNGLGRALVRVNWIALEKTTDVLPEDIEIIGEDSIHLGYSRSQSS